MIRYVLTCILLWLWPSVSVAQQSLPGPIPAELVRVIDGDTIKVRAHIWIGQSVEVDVRLAGVDTPERRGAACAEEKLKAELASRAVEQLVGPGLTIHNVHLGRYAGRVVAGVVTADGVDISDYLLEQDLAVPYGDSGEWCPTATPSAENSSSAAP